MQRGYGSTPLSPRRLVFVARLILTKFRVRAVGHNLRVFAVVIGVVSTIAWAPFAIMVFVSSALHNVLSLLTLWAGAGVLGVTGFWLWIFLAKLRFRAARGLVSVFIVTGILAMAPVSLLGRIGFVVAMPAIVAGAVALMTMWLPRKSERADGIA